MNKFYSLKVSNIIHETPDSVSIEFEVPEQIKPDFAYKQGQYLTIKKVFDNEEIRRSYSICSAPYENKLKIAVKKVFDGRFSTFACKELRKGDVLEVMNPMGNFFKEVLPEQKKKYVLFAAGSGITPIISILKTILNVEQQSEVTLIYGNKRVESIIFREELEDLKNTYVDRFSLFHVLSQDFLGTDIGRGRINAEKCEQFAEHLVDIENIDEFFVCGPFEMTMSVTNWLKSKKIDKHKIHFELFGPPPVKTEADKINEPTISEKTMSNSNSCEVTIIKDGDTIKFNMNNRKEKILDYAYKLGHDLPFSCKGGVCCTCKAKVLEGKVKMEVNYSLEEEEVAEGYVLTCQSSPETSTLTMTFDE